MAQKKHQPDDYLHGAYFVVELEGYVYLRRPSHA